MMKISTIILMVFSLPALAAENEWVITIKDHQFSPTELTVPSGQKIKLVIDNKDATPEEFESHSLNREKVIAGNTSTRIFIGPLEPGRYPYYGEFNQATAQGVIVAK